MSFCNFTSLYADDYDYSFEDGLLEQLTASFDSEEEQIENYKKEVLHIPEDTSSLQDDYSKDIQNSKVVKNTKKALKKAKTKLDEVQDEIAKINNSLDDIRAEQAMMVNDAVAKANSRRINYDHNVYNDDYHRNDFEKNFNNIDEVESVQKDNYFLKATVVNTPAILRSSPSRESGRIYALRTGEVLPVIIHRGQWYLVQANKVRAWIPADVVAVSNY